MIKDSRRGRLRTGVIIRELTLRKNEKKKILRYSEPLRVCHVGNVEENYTKIGVGQTYAPLWKTKGEGDLTKRNR